MIRPACESDIDTVAKLVYKMVFELESLGEFKMVTETTAMETLKKTVAEEIGNSQCCYMLSQNTENDAITGCGFVELIELGPLWEVDKILEIDVLYVEPEHRRRGLGKRIVESLLEWGVKHGCNHCELNTLTNNRAVAFYESLGFEPYRYKMALSV